LGRIRAGAVRVAALGLLPVILAGCPQKDDTGTRDPKKYTQAVRAFYTGVIALRAGDLDRARKNGLVVTDLYPNEPAAWANLALGYLSSPTNDQLDEASKAIERARKLTPKNAEVQFLSGIVEERRGNVEEALTYVRRAVDLDGSNVLALGALIRLVENLAAANADQETEQLYERVLTIDPENTTAAVELARRAARAGDGEKLTRRLEHLAEISSGWPKNASAHLANVRKLAANADPRSMVAPVQVLGNLLLPSVPGRRSMAALGKGIESQVGKPIEHFLRLRQPVATPAPRDEALTFSPQAAAPDKAPWAVSRMLNPTRPIRTSSESDKDVVPPASADPMPELLYPSGGKLYVGARGGPPLPLPGGAAAKPQAVLTIDWNDDHLPDLLCTSKQGLRLFQQSTSKAWADVTLKAALPAAVATAAYTGSWAADIDVEGDLDAVLGAEIGEPLVLRNNGDGTWATARPFPGVRGVRDFAWADFDGDGDGDAALIDGQSTVALFLNERAGRFSKTDLGKGGGKAQALSVTDANNDGTLDLMVLRPGGSLDAVSSVPDAGWSSTQVVQWAGAPTSGPVSLFWSDLDNNGALDLLAAGSGKANIWLRDEQLALQPLASPIDGVISCVEDVDLDGRLDLVGVTTLGQPTRWMNSGTKPYHWQVIRPRNAAAVDGEQKINSFGVGGEMELRSELLFQKQPIAGPRVHFGLGLHSGSDAIRIIWPNGDIQGEFELVADATPMPEQRLKGSCPWLFAFDGESMEFITDVLWKSPLGLAINAQDTAGVSQTRDWVRIRGDQLKPRDGYYDLRVTAELWETDFFDHVSLMVVDHPVGTELLLDERFSIPQPELKLHLTTPPVPVAQARDQRGMDVTDVVRTLDQQYLDTFPLGRYQGVATDHYVEVELPKVSGAGGRTWLVGYGWVYPTDSSINVAISQGRQSKPEGLSLEIPDGKGGWKVARKGLGFPAGKYKSVMLELSDLFPAGALGGKKVRLRTNMEIYWDALAVVSQPANAGNLGTGGVRTLTLQPELADLRYRGFSRIHRPRRSSPETPDYNDVAGTYQKWLDLVGFYTRFGDVGELLTKVDDRYVIMNAGDELALRFKAPPVPAAGWTRDFVFVSDGWDKDGCFNTSYSTTVLPLPSHSRPAYNTPPVPLEQDPVYRAHFRDWLNYHTRYVSLDPLRQALLPRPPSKALAAGSQP